MKPKLPPIIYVFSYYSSSFDPKCKFKISQDLCCKETRLKTEKTLAVMLGASPCALNAVVLAPPLVGPQLALRPSGPRHNYWLALDHDAAGLHCSADHCGRFS